ncbi:MAG: HAD family phosphatase [Deltaproteobacteria bacterium]
MIKVVLFDFGGVIVEEGWREGLKAIAREKRLDPDIFYTTVNELIHETGYVTGMCDESYFWDKVREVTKVTGDNKELREDVLKRFTIRPEVIRVVEEIKALGLSVNILSDQTNWLDEINQRTPFYHHFDRVFNSFKAGKSKRDPSVFRDVCKALGVKPEETLFIDDHEGNVKRASGEGLKAVHFTDIACLKREIGSLLPPH